MREQKNWADKSAKTPITITPLLKKILPKMLFNIPKARKLFAQENVRSLITTTIMNY